MPREAARGKNIRHLISIRRAKVNQKPLARKVQLVNKFRGLGNNLSIPRGKKYNDWS
jgi:hypothetical protein